MKNILVTGGAGYIGSHVCHLLVDNGYNVTCIDSLITGNKKLIPKEVDLNIFDIDEKQKVSNLATVGVYYFQNEADWCNAHEDQIKANDRTNNEFYLAPTYNYVKGNIGHLLIDEMLGMGTPEELEELKQSEWWDRLDEIS